MFANSRGVSESRVRVGGAPRSSYRRHVSDVLFTGSRNDMSGIPLRVVGASSALILCFSACVLRGSGAPAPGPDRVSPDARPLGLSLGTPESGGGSSPAPSAGATSTRRSEVPARFMQSSGSWQEPFLGEYRYRVTAPGVDREQTLVVERGPHGSQDHIWDGERIRRYKWDGSRMLDLGGGSRSRFCPVSPVMPAAQLSPSSWGGAFESRCPGASRTARGEIRFQVLGTEHVAVEGRDRACLRIRRTTRFAAPDDSRVVAREDVQEQVFCPDLGLYAEVENPHDSVRLTLLGRA